MIYLLTAIVLTPGGNSKVHIYTETIHRTTHFGFYDWLLLLLNSTCLCSMKAVLLMSLTALVATHWENRMILEVEQRHLASCVVTLVQQHFPFGRTIQLSSTGDGDQPKCALEAIHRLELWPLQVTGPSRASVSPPNVEKISSYIIFTQSVADITFQAKMLYASASWDSRGLFFSWLQLQCPVVKSLHWQLLGNCGRSAEGIMWW